MKNSNPDLTVEIIGDRPDLETIPEYKRESIASATNAFMTELFRHPNMVQLIKAETARRMAEKAKATGV